MKNWQEDLLSITDDLTSEAVIFDKVAAAARALGFDHCAYGINFPLPLSNPKTILLNNYPPEWKNRYASAGYLHLDPTVKHCRVSNNPMIWDSRTPIDCPHFWEEASFHGLSVGWSQSHRDGTGTIGMVTLTRSTDALSAAEIASQGLKFRWLVNIAHLSLSRVFIAQEVPQQYHTLTGREIEVLRWTGDGKSSQDIADILNVSKNTVDFHVKNAVAKLHTPNKTAAVVRAAMLGLLG